MKKDEKQELVNELHGRLGLAKAAILTDFKGLTVAEVTELRNELRKAQLEYRVVKNTLAKRAAAGTEAALLNDYFEGPTGLVLGFGDPVTPAKVVMDYAKKQEKLKVKVGLIEGTLADANALKAIASLPSREALLSQMAAGFQAPATKMVRLLNATIARFGYALTALEAKKGEAA